MKIYGKITILVIWRYCHIIIPYQDFSPTGINFYPSSFILLPKSNVVINCSFFLNRFASVTQTFSKRGKFTIYVQCMAYLFKVMTESF